MLLYTVWNIIQIGYCRAWCALHNPHRHSVQGCNSTHCCKHAGINCCLNSTILKEKTRMLLIEMAMAHQK